MRFRFTAGPGPRSGLRFLPLVTICLVAPLLLAAPARAQEAGAEDRKPNVIIIFTDDQGTIDANSFGAKDLTTPGIDALAERGVKFTQFYAAAPVCSPSRAGLLTGKYPLAAGLPTNAGPPPVADGRTPRRGRGLPGEQTTIAEMLKQAGYATGHVGKWHLGIAEGQRPGDQGFDYSFGHLGGCIDNYSHFFYWNGPNRHDLWEDGKEVFHPGEFFPDLMVEKAELFMEKHRDEPFFLYFAMNTPHYPYQGEPEWLERYANLDYPRNLYAAFISTLDARIDRLVRKVNTMGLREDTIIIFQSDHGHSTESRAHGGGGSNGPFRGAKFSMFEGGIRVPAIISWPGRLPQNATRAQLAHGTDWLPTIAELCDVDTSEGEIDGRSLLPIIDAANAPSPHDVVHWQTGRGDNAQWAVRRGPWKLIHNVRPTGNEGPDLSERDRQWFLSNLERDRSESTNFAEDHPEKVKELRGLHERWIEGVER